MRVAVLGWNVQVYVDWESDGGQSDFMGLRLICHTDTHRHTHRHTHRRLLVLLLLMVLPPLLRMTHCQGFMSSCVVNCR